MASKTKKDLKTDIKKLKVENKILRDQLKVYEEQIDADIGEGPSEILQTKDIESKLEPESEDKLQIDVDEHGNIISATKDVVPIPEPLVPGVPNEEEEVLPVIGVIGKPIPINNTPIVENDEIPPEELPSVDIDVPVFRCTSKECGWQGSEPRANIWCPKCPRKVIRIA